LTKLQLYRLVDLGINWRSCCRGLSW